MRDSKKAFISTGIVILVFFIISLSFLVIASPYTRDYDWYIREELSGTLDYLIVGASHEQCALYTRKIDQITGNNSYNLSYGAEGNNEKLYFLRKELSRNDVKTVVLGLSYDTLQRSNDSPFTDANISTIIRMDTLSDKLTYFIKNVNFDNKLYVYADIMHFGLHNILLGNDSDIEKQVDLKGSYLLPGKDHSIPKDDVVALYNKDKFSVVSFNEKTISGYTDLINLCKDNNVRIIVAVMPVSDNFLWCTDNLDEFSAWAKDFCAEKNVEYYDFNLLKERYTLFSDIDCYSTDTHHMSEKGSRIFTEVFANIIQEASDGANVSKYFYNTFDEMKQDSPYMSIYKSN